MSIEASAPATHPKGVSASASHGVKGKLQPGTQSDEMTGSGFLALLTALEPDSSGEAVSGISTEAPSDLTMSASAPVATPDAGQVTLLSGSNAADLPTPIESNDLALMLAQADTTAGNAAVMSHARQQPVTQAALPPNRPQPAAAVAMRGNIRIDKPLPLQGQTPIFSDGKIHLVQAGATAAPSAGRLAVLTPAGPQLATQESTVANLFQPAPATAVVIESSSHTNSVTVGKRSANAAIAAVVPVLDQESAAASQTVNTSGDALTQPLPESIPTSRGAESKTTAGINLALSRAMQQASSTEMPASAASLSSVMVNAAVSEIPLRPLDRSQTRSLALATGNGIEGAWRASDAPVGAAATSPQALAEPAAPSVESMVADTLSYWVTHGVQKAELTLDSFGEPVQVSISVKGDEAHLAFRTDQPEIRQILEGATAHLKDILGNEGLLLAGVSVGTSGQHDTGAQQQGHRPEVSLASAAAADGVTAQTQRRGNPSVGSAVDLFV